MKKQKGNLSLFLIIIILTVGVAIYLFVSRGTYAPQNSYSTPSPSPANVALKTFQSKLMKFSIEMSSSFFANEESTRIIVNSADGQIYISRNGTQFDNLDSYLNNFDQNTVLELESDEKSKVDNYEARKRVFKKTDVSEKGEKIYFIYVDSFVYKISTTSPSLYSALDQIAQSFRYIP